MGVSPPMVNPRLLSVGLQTMWCDLCYRGRGGGVEGERRGVEGRVKSM